MEGKFKADQWSGEVWEDIDLIALNLLILAYFSPIHTTGQRYIYSGGMDGRVCMWDIVTGERSE